jgi:glycosyltransferase involved in cell wall biosynthesis
MQGVGDDGVAGNGRLAAAADSAPEISVVVPVYNEVENIPALHESISYALRGLRRSYEVLIVDDGSTDGTREVLRTVVAGDPYSRAILLRRNYGQTTAMAAGFDHARGSIVVTMDGDLQNDPADIPRLIEKLEDGYDIVCGWRRYRRDPWLTRLLPSKIANALISWTTSVPIHDTGCSLKVYRSWVVRNLDLYSDMHRFIAALAAGVGARVAEVVVRHHARRFGRSKYGLGRTLRVVADLVVIKMLIQFSAHPIRWFSLLSLPLFLLSPVMFAVGFLRFRDGQFFGPAFDTFWLTAAVVTSLFAFNVLLLGFLAELQLKASSFFRRRVWTTAREAVK